MSEITRREVLAACVAAMFLGADGTEPVEPDATVCCRWDKQLGLYELWVDRNDDWEFHGYFRMVQSLGQPTLQRCEPPEP